MWKVRSDRMIFTAILNKAAKSARRFQVAGLHSGIDVPHPDGRCRALRKPLQHPTSKPAESEDCRERQQVHRVFVRGGRATSEDVD
jgi:hypothetical protein